MLITYFLTAVALFLVLEGILPFVAPRIWKTLMQQMCFKSDKALRSMGLISMLLGVILLYLVHHQ